MPHEPGLEEIDPSWTGETARVEGEINSKTYTGGNLFLELGNRNLTVVQFEAEDCFREGEEVAVEGKVRIYQGEMEIIADSIE